jgi:competence protein ComEA
MNRKQNILADYFTFSKSQRRGLYAALILLALCTAIRLGFNYLFANKIEPIDNAFAQQVANLHLADTTTFQKENYSFKKYNTYQDDADYNEPNNKKETYEIKGALFAFDPNTLPTQGWQKLGVRDKTIATIQNYLSKGGRFKSPDDIKKIYGLFPNEAERLLPYVKIADYNNTNNTSNNFNANQNTNPSNYNNTQANKPKYTSNIDVNVADTTMLIALPGIGAKLAMRIINYRNKLGGFTSVNQLGETYGLPDSTFQKIKNRLSCNSTNITKYNINTADVNTLKMHPYIKWNIANAIVQYRTQHGNFTTIADIKKIEIIDDALFSKIAPYFIVQ